MAGCGKAVVNWVVSWGWTLVSAPLVVGVVYLCKNPLSKCCCECCALCQAWWWALSKCPQTLTSSQQTHRWRPISLCVIPKKMYRVLRVPCACELEPFSTFPPLYSIFNISGNVLGDRKVLMSFDPLWVSSKTCLSNPQGMDYLIHHCISIWTSLMRSHSTTDQSPESFYESSIKYLHMK